MAETRKRKPSGKRKSNTTKKKPVRKKPKSTADFMSKRKTARGGARKALKRVAPFQKRRIPGMPRMNPYTLGNIAINQSQLHRSLQNRAVDIKNIMIREGVTKAQAEEQFYGVRSTRTGASRYGDPRDYSLEYLNSIGRGRTPLRNFDPAAIRKAKKNVDVAAEAAGAPPVDIYEGMGREGYEAMLAERAEGRRERASEAIARQEMAQEEGFTRQQIEEQRAALEVTDEDLYLTPAQQAIFGVGATRDDLETPPPPEAEESDPDSITPGGSRQQTPIQGVTTASEMVEDPEETDDEGGDETESEEEKEEERPAPTPDFTEDEDDDDDDDDDTDLDLDFDEDLDEDDELEEILRRRRGPRGEIDPRSPGVSLTNPSTVGDIGLPNPASQIFPDAPQADPNPDASTIIEGLGDPSVGPVLGPIGFGLGFGYPAPDL